MGEHAAGYLRGIATLIDHPQQVGVTIADITERPATTFAEWAAAHADAFRWAPIR